MLQKLHNVHIRNDVRTREEKGENAGELGVRGLRHPSPLPGGSGIRRLCLVGLAQASVGVVPCVWVVDHGILRRRTPR